VCRIDAAMRKTRTEMDLDDELQLIGRTIVSVHETSLDGISFLLDDGSTLVVYASEWLGSPCVGYRIEGKD